MKRLFLSCIAVALPLAATASCKGCNQDSSTSASSDAGATADAFTFDAAAVKALQESKDAGSKLPPWNAIPGATAPLLPNMGIPERFDIERKSRPANIKPNVESVMKALRDAGIKIDKEKQHLGQPFGARYCVGGEVPGGDAGTPMIWLSVCEFVAAEVANLSKDFAPALASQVNDRTVHANKQTTLIVRLGENTPENKAVADKMFGIYDKL